jgi:hypothetical protein
MDNLSKTEKLDLLLHLHKHVKEEVDFLRKRQDQIFNWTSGILMGLIGALLIIEPSKHPVWGAQLGSKLVVSAALLVFITFSVVWQQRTRRWHGENGQVILKMEQLMHCYDEGYFDPAGETVLFPSRWNKPPEAEIPGFKKRLFAANYVSATILIGMLAIAMVWVRR